MPSSSKRSKRPRRRGNGPFQDQDVTAIGAIFWNAGGLSNDKFTELKTILTRENSDVFAIVEAGASTDTLDYYRHRGFVLYALPRSRQIASGIIVGVKDTITANFRVLHKMDDNKFESVELNLWKGNSRTKLIFVYNPPGNHPLTQILESALDRNTIIIGDFNSHSPRWGYKDANPQGKIIEDFLDSTATTLMQGAGHTFLSYKGERTSPDLAIAHTNIAPTSSLDLLESCSGHGHRILCVRRFPRGTSRQPITNSLPKWNFKKADWTRFSELTDLLFTPDLIDETNPDKSYDAISEAIRICALETIPRGRVKQYKPFWTVELTDLKTKRDNARDKAELSGSTADNIALRRAQAALKKAIKHTKRDCFKDFAANLDFRQDGIRAHRFLSSLRNDPMTNKNEILYLNGKSFTTNNDKALAFAKHYASVCSLHRNKLNGPRLPREAGCIKQEDDQVFNDSFTYNELLLAMKETKKGKSPGPDDLPSELFLNLGSGAKLTLLLFYNTVWKTHVPSEWRKAIIIPILKPNKPAVNPSSYRPISLTNACCKLMERRYQIVNRLNYFLETNKKTIRFPSRFSKEKEHN